MWVDAGWWGKPRGTSDPVQCPQPSLIRSQCRSRDPLLVHLLDHLLLVLLKLLIVLHLLRVQRLLIVDH